MVTCAHDRLTGWLAACPASGIACRVVVGRGEGTSGASFSYTKPDGLRRMEKGSRGLAVVGIIVSR